MDVRERYKTEPVFRQAVDLMVSMLLASTLTPHDLARAAVLAATIYAERYGQPIQIVFLPGGEAQVTTLADKIRAEILARFNTDQEAG